MTYPLRLEAVGETFHVNTKAVAGTRVFRDDEDRALFLSLMRREVARSQWICLAYSVLGTHYHVLLRLRQCTLSSGMQHLNGGYARSFNGRYRRRGALWQRRFYDTLIESDAHLLEVNRYIALNAVRAGLCERPEDYQWCSYGAAIGKHPPDPLVDENELLELFGQSRERARRRLQQFVEEGDERVRRALLRR